MRNIPLISKKHKTRRFPRLGVGWYISFIVIAELAAVLALATGISYIITDHFTESLPSSAWVVIVGIIIGIPLSIFVNRAVLSPIRKLGDAMNMVGKGSFGIQISTNAPFSDIEDIYRNFNLMTRELAATEILKTDFVSNVSHEIKTPVTAIEGYAMLLQESETLSSEDAEYAEKILINSQRLSKLVENVLLLSKIDNQAIIETTPEVFRLDEQIRQSVLLLEPKWDEKNIDLDVDLERVSYTGNKELLIHVWNNLIGNAVKFTPPYSTLRITLVKQDEKAVFAVEDQGPGIPAEAMNHIFDKFYQGDSSHRQEGNGLGLALVKRILDMVDGEIKAENMDDGGCRFVVIL